MNTSKIGSWLKAIAGVTAAVGLYTFSDSQIANIEIYIAAGWAFANGAINAFKGWNK